MTNRKFMPYAAAILATILLSAAAPTQDQVAIPTQAANPELRAKLPKKILDAGELVAVNSGSFPPYDIIGDNQVLTGASADLETAVGELLGIQFRNETVSGLAGVLGGIKAGRYQLDMGPDGDFPDREPANDFIDWVREYVAFAVPKGNPKHINDITDTCGLSVAVQSGGSAEQVIKRQSGACTEAGKPAVEVQSFGDQPTALLAVRSGRSDAFFSSQAPLTYFVHQTNGQLELAAIGKSNGFATIYQGSVVQKGSLLGPVLLESYQILFHNGTYAAIMRKWHLEGNMVPEPGLDLATMKKP